MKIVNKRKFAIRVIEILVIIITIILTLKAIKYATQIRGYKAFGGEYLIPVFGRILVIIVDAIYENYLRKQNRKNIKNRRK